MNSGVVDEVEAYFQLHCLCDVDLRMEAVGLKIVADIDGLDFGLHCNLGYGRLRILARRTVLLLLLRMC